MLLNFKGIKMPVGGVFCAFSSTTELRNRIQDWEMICTHYFAWDGGGRDGHNLSMYIS